MQYTGYSLSQASALELIDFGLTGATGVEGLIISNYSDFNSKNTTYTSKNTIQDGFLSNLETKATNLELGATGLAGRATTLGSDFVTIQGREDALLAGLTGTAGVTGLEGRAVNFNTNILDINNKLNGEIQDTINLKVAENIFQTMKTNFEDQYLNYQSQLATKVETATQQVLDARQDSDDAVLEKKFCSVEEFAQTFLQTYTIEKIDKSLYSFNGKIQVVDKAPPIFSIIEKKQSTSVPSAWELKIKLTDYGYNVMSGNIVVKNGSGTVVNTLSKTDFDAVTKTYTLSLAGSNSSGSLVGGPYTFEYQTSTGKAVYVLVLNSALLAGIPAPAVNQITNLFNIDITTSTISVAPVNNSIYTLPTYTVQIKNNDTWSTLTTINANTTYSTNNSTLATGIRIVDPSDNSIVFDLFQPPVNQFIINLIQPDPEVTLQSVDIMAWGDLYTQTSFDVEKTMDGGNSWTTIGSINTSSGSFTKTVSSVNGIRVVDSSGNTVASVMI